MPKEWKQGGPLGDCSLGSAVDWRVEARYECMMVVVGAGLAWVKRPDHLRDFARALNRAADALEGKE